MLAAFFIGTSLGWYVKWTDEGVARKNEDMKEISRTIWLKEENEGYKINKQN